MAHISIMPYFYIVYIGYIFFSFRCLGSCVCWFVHASTFVLLYNTPSKYNTLDIQLVFKMIPLPYRQRYIRFTETIAHVYSLLHYWEFCPIGKLLWTSLFYIITVKLLRLKKVSCTTTYTSLTGPHKAITLCFFSAHWFSASTMLPMPQTNIMSNGFG